MTSSKIILQGICYDAKSSFQRGAAKAPPIIRDRLWSDAYNLYAENGNAISQEFIEDKGDFEINEYWDIERFTESNLSEKAKLLTLGGDHSITYPVLKALSKYHNDFSILHIDAHADLYDNFEGDKYSHACPFARIMEDGLTNRLVQVGIRTLTSHQRAQASKFNVEIIEMKDFSVSSSPVFRQPVYLSLDIDAFDPAFAPGVAHQESGGLNAREVLKLLANIETPIIGADIVEFNPDNDIAGITAALCGKMAKEIIAEMLS